MGAAMPRFDSHLYPIGLIMVALLVLDLMVIRSAEKGGRGYTAFEPGPHTNGGRTAPDIGVADLRGSLTVKMACWTAIVSNDPDVRLRCWPWQE
jgi:hypothetical protein